MFRAMASSGGKEQFLRQMEQIVEGIKQSRMKVQNALPRHTNTHTYNIYANAIRKSCLQRLMCVSNVYVLFKDGKETSGE